MQTQDDPAAAATADVSLAPVCVEFWLCVDVVLVSGQRLPTLMRRRSMARVYRGRPAARVSAQPSRPPHRPAPGPLLLIWTQRRPRPLPRPRLLALALPKGRQLTTHRRCRRCQLRARPLPPSYLAIRWSPALQQEPCHASARATAEPRFALPLLAVRQAYQCG